MMTVSLNDAAYELEKAIRQSEEYVQLKQAYLAVEADETAKVMFDQLRQVQMNLQQKQMMGQEITQAEVEQVQSIMAHAQQNEKISFLIQAEQRLGLIIGKLNLVFMRPLEEIYGTPQF